MNNDSLFLQQPVDIILHIIDQLPPESAIALGLTCRALSCLILDQACKRLSHDPNGRRAFLQLLEKDIGYRYYFCHDCNRLHRFHPGWHIAIDPKSQLPLQHPRELLRDNCYSTHGASTLYTKGMYCPYRYFRLIMNRHFFGGSSGLPIKILDHTVDSDFPHPRLQWKVKWTGRIIDDELFLHGTHRLLHRRGTAASILRKGVDRYYHFICYHVRTCPSTITHGQVTFLDRRSDSDPFIPCRDRLGFCSECLTDYTVTTEPVDTRNMPGPWRIVVKSYHQVGSGRTPSDWKWMSYTGKLVDPRDMSRWAAGAVVDKWNSQQPVQNPVGLEFTLQEGSGSK